MKQRSATDAQTIVPDILRSPVPLTLWAGVIFTSAFLLFEIEPILAKIILPWFGGSAGVWTVSLMFFQITYLLGNAYAHWLVNRASSRMQTRLHAMLLAVSLLLLPIIPKDFWKPSGAGDPTWRILGLLAVTIGLPFLLLSATSPLLQTWYSRERENARPYRFYALSNFGSLLALLAYPVIIEPNIGTRHQALGWSYAYAVFVVLTVFIAIRQTASPAAAVLPARSASTAPDWRLQLLWIALAADASILLLAITNYLSQNVAAVPLLWILPLSLYLLSMILCFEGGSWYRRFVFLRFTAVALGGMAFALSPDFVNAGPLLQIPLFCAGLFVCCMTCHGELAILKPSREHLTLFYLMVSLGGALGGIFVGVIAPYAFRGFYELPIGIAGCAVLLWIVLHHDPTTIFYRARTQAPSLILTGLTVLLIASLFVVTRRQSEMTRLMQRNFYGVLRVRDLIATDSEPLRRELLNGTIVHGVEILESDRRKKEPTTYYSPESGVGRALQASGEHGPINVGIVGLGTGTLASYGRAGDRYRIYEINPGVIHIAATQFDFLRDSGARIEIVPGDARLSLEREATQNFNVLVVDAFSGDAIPVHLLTREAFQLYLGDLAPQGILAVHISNKYLDLAPVVEAAARDLGVSWKIVVNQSDKKQEILASSWMLVSRDSQTLADPHFPEITFFEKQPRGLRVWTDDYSNLLRILK